MSNAWCHYLGPLVISIVFVTAGVISLCMFWWSPRDANGKRKVGWSGIVGGIFGLAVGGGVGVPFVLTAPTPGEREELFDHIFRTPPERIERFIIKAGRPEHATPLIHFDVVIDDPERIGKIAEILRTAPEVSANHPRTRWYAVAQMVTPDGTYEFGVLATVPGDRNGTLLMPHDQSGWNLGDVRADGLEEILEDAVNKARKRD